MAGALRSKAERHDAIVEFLAAIPIERIRDMLQQPGELDRRLSEKVRDYTFGEFVAALKEVADRQQHDADALLAEAERLAAEKGGR